MHIATLTCHDPLRSLRPLQPPLRPRYSGEADARRIIVLSAVLKIGETSCFLALFTRTQNLRSYPV